MKIFFDDPALEELFEEGCTSDSKYKKLPKQILKQFVSKVNMLKCLSRIEDLYNIKSLHYEKKKGDLKGIEAIWINDQYRLLFNSYPDSESVVVSNLLLLSISKHYEN